MSKSRKAEIEIQFNWILVLVAGALIFLFFFSLVRWAQSSAEQETSTTLVTYLDSIFTGASVTKETVNLVEIPFKSVEFTCNDYTIGKSSRNIRNKIVFAPSRLEKEDIITWTKGWDVPFRVTNFLYVSSPRIRYLFFGDEGDEVYAFLRSNFPAELTADFNPSTIINQNNFKVRAIFVNTNIDEGFLDEFRKMDVIDATGLVVQGDLLSGDVEFLRKTHPSTPQEFRSIGSADYFSDASLLGAIFSEDNEEYDCVMKKAFDRLDSVAEIYSDRANQMYNNYVDEGDSRCEQAFAGVSGFFDLLIDPADPYFELIDNYEQFIFSNRDAQKASCVLVY
ncbi:hypothetical protein GOV09_02535 [Candidatus Woesearchaeota archaeon]|nr:hypothetical protein [Candidatus Woesearchaeota archaeon]